MSGVDDSDDGERREDLERTITLPGAVTIGTGTMIGAGIFVFPGLAAGRAGPAATISFAIGAAVALLIALPTAELATAMPESGGGYYFISRGIGATVGSIVGIGLTLGLVFAAAFYLVGFGEYALAIVAIVGTENVEALQNSLVGVLVAILVVFLLRSGLDVLGLLAHFALTFVGGIAIGLVLVGRIEILAEVASFLHLVMYGAICLTHLELWRTDPGWYEPTFQCPGTPYVPLGGTLASVGLIVPVEILEGDVIPDALIEFLSTVPVVLLGYHKIPEQTLTEQARDEYGEQATEELTALAETFESYGGTVETELVFTHDPAKAIRRVADDVDRGVILHSNPVQTVEQVIVAVRRADLAPAITATAGALVGPTGASITLLSVTTADESEESGHRVLTGMTTTLEEAGVSKQRITQRVERADDVETVLLEASSEYDLVILGEDDPGILRWLFGSTTERVAERTMSPVLVVQRSLAE